MRIRSIKPEYWRSEDISVLNVEDRLLFIGLWSYVDDNGVGIDRLATVSADLFAGDIERDAPETFARVSRGLQNLSEAGLITRYEVDGKRFLHVTNWGRHQRIDKPNKPRYPLPTSGNESVAEPSRECRESPAPGTEEQGNRGTGEVKTPSTADAFEAFWSVYPRKVAKKAAKSKWDTAVKTTDPAQIVEGAKRYAKKCEVERTEKKFIKQPDGWLNAGRWEDEIEVTTVSVKYDPWSKEAYSA